MVESFGVFYSPSGVYFYFSLFVLRTLNYFSGILSFLFRIFRFYYLGSAYHTPNSYLHASLDSAEFENMFKDSGYWDYFILLVYDIYFRLYGVYSLFVITDFSVVEKASWRGIGAILWPLNQVFFLELRNINELFGHTIIWVITSLCSFWLISNFLIFFIA
jgi:hypothetical protein